MGTVFATRLRFIYVESTPRPPLRVAPPPESCSARPMDAELPTDAREIDGAELRSYRVGATGIRFEYEDRGRIFRASWDPRDDGNTCWVALDTWLDGTTMTEEEKLQVARRLWAFGVGARALMVFTPEGAVARGIQGASGFLIDVGSQSIAYHEVDHLLVIPTREAGLDERKCTIYALELPAQPSWTSPAREAIEKDRWQQILARLAGSHGRERVDQSGHRLQVPGFPISPGY